MFPFNFFRGKDSSRVEYERALVTTTTAGETNKPSDPASDYIEMTGKMGYMVMDEIVIKILSENPYLQPLLFLFSQLNSTGKLDKHQAELKRIRLEKIITMMRLTMPEAMYEANGYETLATVRMFGHDRINEAVDGWKGHLVTEQVKKIEVRTPHEKRGFGK